MAAGRGEAAAGFGLGVVVAGAAPDLGVAAAGVAAGLLADAALAGLAAGLAADVAAAGLAGAGFTGWGRVGVWARALPLRSRLASSQPNGHCREEDNVMEPELTPAFVAGRAKLAINGRGSRPRTFSAAHALTKCLLLPSTQCLAAIPDDIPAQTAQQSS